MSDGRVTADDVRSAEFSMAKKGYDPQDVDILLEQVAVALERGEPVAELVTSARLRTGARRGYAHAGVDALLERLAPGRRAPQPEAPVSEGRGLFGFLRRG